MAADGQDERAGNDPSPAPSDGLGSARFRHVIGHLAGGVTVVTASGPSGVHGMTASSVTSLSLEPPTLICCLNRRSTTGQVVARAGRFAVNILEEGQANLAERFALNLPHEEKFAGVALANDPGAPPLLADALAHLVCRVREVVDGGTHLLFISDVEQAETRPGRPLAYYRGTFGYFALDEDVTVRDRLRAKLLAGELEAGTPVDLPVLAARLAASATALNYALRELVAEGLLRRDATAGYVVADPVEQEHDRRQAALAIELGALALADRAELAQARTLWREARLVATANARRAVELHRQFHIELVGLARSQSLLHAYRSLEMPPDKGGQLGAELDADHEVLVALEADDLSAARAALVVHYRSPAATPTSAS